MTAQTARTPTEALIITLRELGLRHRKGKDADGYTAYADFAVRGVYLRSHYRRTHERVRDFTTAIFYSRHATEVAAENREQIERRTAELGYPFKVRIYTSESGRTDASVTNG